MKRKTGIIIAVISGLLAALLVNFYLNNLEKQYTEGEKLVDVLVARAYIPKTTVVKPSLVKAVKIPARYIQPLSLHRKEDLLDQNQRAVYLTSVPIMEGEQILSTKLTLPGKGVGLAVTVPPRMRAIAIPVDESSGVAGLIKPGDYVDILATFDLAGGKSYTFTLLQNILVLSCGSQILGVSAELRKKTGEQKIGLPGLEEFAPSCVTVALTPQQAVTVTFAKEKGKISLSLRPPGEKKETSSYAVSLDAFAPGEKLSAQTKSAIKLKPQEIKEIQQMILKKYRQ